MTKYCNMSCIRSPTNIHIRLIRDLDNDKNDDRITIVNKGEDVFHIYFYDSFMKTPITTYIALTGSGLDSYLKSLFNLVSNDRDPYLRIQFDVPCFPSVMYNTYDLQNESVIDSLMSIMPLCKVSDVVKEQKDTLLE